MELLPDGSYTVNGIYPDIFYALQVIAYNPLNCQLSITFAFIVKEILNFTSVLSKPPDGKWGGKNPDGSWNGMVSQLMMNKSDISKKKKIFYQKIHMKSTFFQLLHHWTLLLSEVK